MQQIREGMKACDDSANSMSQLPFIYFSFLATNQVDEGEKKWKVTKISGYHCQRQNKERSLGGPELAIRLLEREWDEGVCVCVRVCVCGVTSLFTFLPSPVNAFYTQF